MGTLESCLIKSKIVFMNESFPGSSEPIKTPVEQATLDLNKAQGIRMAVAELAEGTYLWNDIKRHEATKATSQFTAIEAAHMINKSSKEQWDNNPAFYMALVELAEQHISTNPQD